MNVAIILAAGSGKRAKENKLWANIFGSPLWTLSYETFLKHPKIDRIILVVGKNEKKKFEKYIKENFSYNRAVQNKTQTMLCVGGSTRTASFLHGLKLLEKPLRNSKKSTTKERRIFENSNIILDHNAANPLVTSEEISAVIKAATRSGAAAVSHSAVDTILKFKNGKYIEKLERNELRLMQTPQAVRADILKKVRIKESGDLSGALLNYCKIAVVEASPQNKKITYPEDIKNLQNFFSNSDKLPATFIGEDSHAFPKSSREKMKESYAESNCLILGGLEIKSLPKLKANSDGDVILHALGRALAAAKNESFSKHADMLCKSGIKDGKKYLQKFLRGIKIQMLSISIDCAKPKIDDLPLAKSLAKILKIPESKIRISAYSGEGSKNFNKGIRATAIITIL